MSRGDDIDLIGDGRESAVRPRPGREGELNVRLARVRIDNPRLFISRVNAALARSRAATGCTKFSGMSGRFNARGRGAKVAPGLKGHGAWTVEPGSGSGPRLGVRFRARRAIVKARVVKLAGVGAKAAQAHLRYLMREGASLERSAEDIAAERARADAFDLQRYRGPESAREGSDLRDALAVRSAPETAFPRRPGPSPSL